MTMRNTILASLYAEEKDHEILNGVFTLWHQLKTMDCLADEIYMPRSNSRVCLMHDNNPYHTRTPSTRNSIAIIVTRRTTTYRCLIVSGCVLFHAKNPSWTNLTPDKLQENTSIARKNLCTVCRGHLSFQRVLVVTYLVGIFPGDIVTLLYATITVRIA